jgi:uncharacterized damage-inducible protein DinB
MSSAGTTAVDQIEEFAGSWKFIRGMTHQFVESVPAQHWVSSPHPDYSSLAKQFRHIIWVTGLYTEALRNGKTDLALKKSNYAGSIDKSDIVRGLKDSDAKLEEILSALKSKDFSTYRIEHFGCSMTFGEYTHVIIQHESLHQGMWALYAKVAGFPTPKGWKENWEL